MNSDRTKEHVLHIWEHALLFNNLIFGFDLGSSVVVVVVVVIIIIMIIIIIIIIIIIVVVDSIIIIIIILLLNWKYYIAQSNVF